MFWIVIAFPLVVFHEKILIEPEKSLPLGGKVSPKVTDEGITLPIDVGLGEAVCLPRITEVPIALC